VVNGTPGVAGRMAAKNWNRCVHDALPHVLVDVERPIAALLHVADDQAVVSRVHARPTATAASPWRERSRSRSRHARQPPRRAVGHLGLRHHDRELTFHRDQLLVVEERLRSESRAVDDHRFGERQKIARRLELANDDAAAVAKNIAHERFEVDRRLDPEVRSPDRILSRKRMFAWSQDLAVDDTAQALRDQIAEVLAAAAATAWLAVGVIGGVVASCQ
jgi:hypothetical protein